MKLASIVAILLIAFGLFGLVSGYIDFTTKKEIAHIGPIEATEQKHHVITIPQVAGVLALIGGIAILVVGSRRA